MVSRPRTFDTTWARRGGEVCRGEQAEKAREKYPERLRKGIGVGVIRTTS
jgi:hypothetical protein